MRRPLYRVPSIAPSGMAFSIGDLVPAWKGNYLRRRATRLWLLTDDAAGRILRLAPVNH